MRLARLVGLVGLASAALASLGLEAWAQGLPPSVAPPPPTVVARTLARPLEPAFLSLGGFFGGAARLDDGTLSAPEPALSLGLAASLAPTKQLGFGLEYEHAFLGRERVSRGLAQGTVRREAMLPSLRLEATPLGRERVGPLVELGVGLAFEQQRGAGLAVRDGRAQPFTCEAVGGPGFSLRGGLGLFAKLSGGPVVTLLLSARVVQLSADADGCAPGLGSAVTLGGRLGVAWDVDVTRVVR